MTEEFDVVVIGSGAGGAPVAYELARANRTVLVLEKGPLMRTQGERGPGSLSDFKRDELFNAGPERIITVPGMTNTGASFYASHVEPDLNDEPHVFTGRPKPEMNPEGPKVTIEGYTAQVVGGGTQLYGAVSLRFTPNDFRLRSYNQGRQLQGDPDGDALDEVRDWPISYQTLEPYYDKAERLLGISGATQGQAKPFSGATYQTPLPPNPISEFARAGMAARGYTTYRTPLAVISQDHVPSRRKAGDPQVGYVNRYGDPLGYKSSTWVALLRPTIEEARPLELRPNCVVTHLEADGASITRVHYRDSSGRPRVARGTVVVVACSAIESTRLLMLSAEEDRPGFGSRLRYGAADSLLGRCFLTHAFGGAEVPVPGHRFDKSISLDSDYATDACADQAFLDQHGLWAGAVVYNNTSDQSLPVTLARTDGSTDLDFFWAGFQRAAEKRGDAVIRWLEADFGTRLSVSFMANQIPVRDNRIELHPAVRDKWNRPVAHIIKDWHPHDGHLMGKLADVCRDILLAGVPGVGPNDISAGSVYGNAVRIANHILGGMRFGTDPADSVLDPGCRAWGFDNLFVTDGAFMPTSGGANPTLTIEANAFRVADALKAFPFPPGN